MAKRLGYGQWALVAGALLASAAQGEELLPDPTRPPAELGTGAVAASAPQGPVLQSVMISKGRRMAVISGQLLQEGDPYGEAKLVKIAENEVLLESKEGMLALKLLPGVEKNPAAKTIAAPVAPGDGAGMRKNEKKAR